jgi:hypothetical protein
VDLRIALSGLFALALAACAAPTSQTTVTSASVPAPAAAPAAPAAKEAAVETTTAPPPGPGQLACRAETRDEGTTELYLDWHGSTAKGLLRRIAPSGNVSEQSVTAERYKSLIIADDVNATDLAVHAATIAEVGGKKRIRLAEVSSWAECR